MTLYEKVAVQQAASSVTKVVTSFCNMMAKAIDEGNADIQAAQEGIRTLNHAACAMERLYRILENPEPGTSDGI